MKALYSRHSDRELATISWGGLDGVRGQFEAFSRILEQLDADAFGTVTEGVRIRRDGERDPVEYTLEQFRNGSHGASDRLIDAKLGLEPVVLDSKIELVELYLEDRIGLGEVPLRAVGGGWAIIGRPSGTEPEPLLFVDVLFDMPSAETSLSFSFRSKTDLWLSYGLHGEPTGPEHRANRAALQRALEDLAARTGGDLELEELAIDAPAR